MGVANTTYSCCQCQRNHTKNIFRAATKSLQYSWVLQIQPILVDSVSETTQRTFLEQQQNLCNILCMMHGNVLSSEEICNQHAVQTMFCQN